MPSEYVKLKDRVLPIYKCPKCGMYPFKPSVPRGIVQSGWRKFMGMKYCAIICGQCDEIVKWEKP